MAPLLVLRITAGSRVGQQVWLRPGQVLRIGSTEWADYSVSDDGLMSGVHFLVKAAVDGCQVRDLQSKSGTFLNGETVKDAWLADGDRIHAGTTQFTVEMTGIASPPRLSNKRSAPMPPAEDTVPRVDRSAGVPCAHQRLPSTVHRYLPLAASDNGDVAALAENLQETGNVYLAINPRAFRVESMVGLASLRDALRISPNLLLVDTTMAGDWQELLAYVWGKNAAVLITSQLTPQELLANLQDVQAIYSHPTLMVQQLESAPLQFIERLLFGVETIVVETMAGESWQLFSRQHGPETMAELGLTGAPGHSSPNAETTGTGLPKTSKVSDRLTMDNATWLATSGRADADECS